MHICRCSSLFVEHWCNNQHKPFDDPRVRRAEVSIDKPAALDGAEAAGCTVAWVR